MGSPERQKERKDHEKAETHNHKRERKINQHDD
jgi:hypothetical protein